MLLVGETPLAAKYLSLGFSVLTVALLYAVGCRLRHPRLGVSAAALMAISEIQVINAAAVRDFIAASFFAALSTHAFLGLLRNWQKDRGPSLDPEDERTGAPSFSQNTLVFPGEGWAPFVLATVAGLLTSYLNIGVLAAQVLYALLKTPVWRLRRQWVGGLAAIGILYAPWGWEALATILEKLNGQQAPRPPEGNAASLGSFLVDALRHLLANEFAAFDPLPVEAFYLLVPLAGLAYTWSIYRRRAKRSASPPFAYAGFVFLSLVVSLAVTYGVAHVWLHLALPSRYVVVASPFFVILVAMGLDALAEIGWPAPSLALAVLTLAAALGLRDFYARPPLPPSIWNPTGMVEFLDTRARDGDGLIFITPEQAGYYDSLSKRRLSWNYFFIGPSYLEGGLRDKLDRVLPEAAAKYDALWLVFYQDGIAPSSRMIVSWLNENTYPSDKEALSDSVVMRYISARGEPPQRALAANFGNLIRLKDAGYPPEASPGGDVKLAIIWEAITRIGADYTVFAHLLDDKGQRRAQHDAPPQNGEVATSLWRPGDTFLDRRAISLPTDLPVGKYWIEVGLYSGEDRLDLTKGGSAVRLGPIEVKGLSAPGGLPTR